MCARLPLYVLLLIILRQPNIRCIQQPHDLTSLPAKLKIQLRDVVYR